MESIDKELQKYRASDEFAEDCESLKSEYIIKSESLPDDFSIEKQVLTEKRKALLTEKECGEKGHIFLEGDEEMVNGKTWVCCGRCGKWFDKGGDEK